MLSFNKPNSLNGEQLRKELRSAGVAISDENDAVRDSADGYIHLDIATKDKSLALEVVANHVGVDVVKVPTLVEKLASVGISLDELKAAL
jgi:hypothetical protein